MQPQNSHFFGKDSETISVTIEKLSETLIIF